MTLVSGASKIAEYGDLTMSDETIGASLYARMSLARSRNSALISSTDVSRSRLDRQVDDRAGRDRHAHGETVQLAGELRE